MERTYFFGISTENVSKGSNLTYFATPFSPIIEIAWSIPPPSTPENLSDFAARFEISDFDIFISNIYIVIIIDEHTKADEDDNPDPLGTLQI